MSSRTPLLVLAGAQTLSVAGTSLSAIAIPWLVLTSTGSPLGTGLVVMTEMLPYVLAKALSGPLIDRLGARRIAVVCDVLSSAVLALVPLIVLFGAASLALLLPVVFVMGCLRGPSDAAKQSLVPDVARRAAWPLERVTGIASTVERVASTVGAAAGGLLIAVLGSAGALAVNAGCFAAAALIVGLGLPAAGREPVAGRRGSYLADLGDGGRFLLREPVLFGIVVMVALTNLLDQAFQSVLLPVWVRDAGQGADWLGWLSAAFSGGCIVGAAIATTLAERLPRLPVYTVAFLLTGLPRFAVFAIGAPLPVVLAVLIVSGFAAGFLNPVIHAVMFERIPPSLTGRVTALTSAFCWALIPFGGLFGGALIALLGTANAFVVSGVGYAIITLLPLLRRSFRGLSGPGKSPAEMAEGAGE